MQKLQVARRDLGFKAALAKQDRFDLIARRYEYRRIAIAANQTFCGWDQIFPDKAMTVAAIDRLVHHAKILKMNAESFRQPTAAASKPAQDQVPPTTTNDNQTQGEI